MCVLVTNTYTQIQTYKKYINKYINKHKYTRAHK